jgi:CRP-like cAMP-binding protein
MTTSDTNKCALVAQMPSTRPFTAKELAILATLFQHRSYHEHDEIYSMNSPAAAAYYVIEGSVGIFKKCDGNTPERIAYIRPAQWFGYSALVCDKDRDAAARALEKTSCFVLFTTDFLELKHDHCQCALQLLTNICCDLMHNLQEIQIDYYSLAGKLARANVLV